MWATVLRVGVQCFREHLSRGRFSLHPSASAPLSKTIHRAHVGQFLGFLICSGDLLTSLSPILPVLITAAYIGLYESSLILCFVALYKHFITSDWTGSGLARIVFWLLPLSLLLSVSWTRILNKEVKTVSVQTCLNYNEKAIKMSSRDTLIPNGCLGHFKYSWAHFSAASSWL